MNAKFTVIRTDGSEEEHHAPKGRALMGAIHAALKIDTADSVNLRDGRVMVVDDRGYQTEVEQVAEGHLQIRPTLALKPVNAKATVLYHRVCIPGTTHQIVGDVAIAVDEDFA